MSSETDGDSSTQRLDGFERRLKVLTFVIAIFALLAPAASAAAAWMTFHVAAKSSALQTAVITAGSTVRVAGACDPVRNTTDIVIRVTFVNEGHLAGTIKGAAVGVLAETTGDDSIGTHYVPSGHVGTDLTLAALDSTTLDIPMSCAKLQVAGVNMSNAGSDLVNRIVEGPDRTGLSFLVLVPDYGTDANTTGRRGVDVNYAEYDGPKFLE